ncbi:flagellar biosynthesis regulator FlaF [Amaricoccus tamworthensis]|uniref:flagellar biosynthesis regulator FlaF n=1 Tax=Amaricoccus tamworthensis TaxID=57002 RepID=UPI003C7DB659
MNNQNNASSGYAAAVKPTRTDRGMEYKIFARVTHRMKSVDETDRASFPELAKAVAENSRLWAALAEDLMSEENKLSDEMKGQLISLAMFVARHTHAVLSGRESVEPLIDINTSIMRGLRGNGGSKSVEAAA